MDTSEICRLLIARGRVSGLMDLDSVPNRQAFVLRCKFNEFGVAIAVHKDRFFMIDQLGT